jgi:two-component system, sensor histidine kinase
MGGTLVARSELGVGSTFTFEILLAPSADLVSEEPACPTFAHAPEDHSREGPQRRRRVLLVEDNAVNQAIARVWLQRFGCDVECAVDGRQALELAARQSYDGIFMDCQMPEMDGYEATAELRRREDPARRTRIVAMTAHAMAGERERCLAAGMDDFLTKPIDKHALRAAVESLPLTVPGRQPADLRRLAG